MLAFFVSANLWEMLHINIIWHSGKICHGQLSHAISFFLPVSLHVGFCGLNGCMLEGDFYNLLLIKSVMQDEQQNPEGYNAINPLLPWSQCTVVQRLAKPS